MRKLELLLVMLLAGNCQCQEAQEHSSSSTTLNTVSVNKLIGRWKSNRELTWASAKSTAGISPSALEYLNQNVFGLARREFTDDKMRTFFGRIKPGDKTIAFQPYRVVEQNQNSIQIESVDPLSDKNQVFTLYWDLSETSTGCYYELVSEWQYREYFCPEEESKTKFIAVPKSYQQ